MRTRIAFLDTSVFMHCKPPDQIDWLELLTTEEAVLVVQDVVAGELNEAKDRHPNVTLRHRARTRLNQLHEWWKDSLTARIRDSVTIRYAATNSHAACVSRNLDSTLMDDRLLACALEFSERNPGGDIVFVTQDAHFGFKARYHGLKTFMPAGEDVLEELDPAEKENRDIRRQVQLSQSRVPRLQFGFADGPCHMKVQLEPLQEESPEAIAADMAEVRRKYPRLEWPKRIAPPQNEEPLRLNEVLSDDIVLTIPARRSDQEFVDIRGLRLAITKQELAAYNSRVEKFYKETQDWLIESIKHANRDRRTFSFQFRIINRGTVPARHVRVILSVPFFFFVTEECPLRAVPKKPEPPEPPETSPFGKSQMFSSLQRPDLYKSLFSQLDFSSRLDESRPLFEPTDVGYEVRFHLSKLPHDDLGKELGPVWVAFRSGSKPSSFQMPYAIYSDDLPEKIEGKLHVVIQDCEDLMTQENL